MRLPSSLATRTGRARPTAGSGSGRGEDETRLAARALGYLFLAGATIGLVSLQLPTPPHANMGGLYSNVVLAYAGAAALLVGATWVRPWMLQVALATGSLLIARAVVLSGSSVSFYSVWFIWVGLYACFFFRRRVAAAHVAFASLLYAATLINDPPGSPIARWLTTVSTLIVAGVFIDMLVRRAREQADAAAQGEQSMAQVTELAHFLAALSDPGAARHALCEGSMHVTHAMRGCLWELSPNGSALELTAVAGSRTGPGAVSLSGPPSLLLEAFASARAVWDDEASGSRSVGRARVRLWQPIVRERLPVGVLELSWADPGAREDPAVAALTRLLAVEASVTLQRVQLIAELEAMARTDELTGLPNRRSWQEQIPKEVMRADRSQAPLSVAMLDLDHFKRYNDTQGHQSGDRLLMQVAAAWSIEIRPTDVLSRYGGEEFALALPDCPLEEAQAVVERLRASIPDGQTCSAGIAAWDGTESVAELVGRADHALYRAKRGGRDRIAAAATPASRAAVG